MHTIDITRYLCMRHIKTIQPQYNFMPFGIQNVMAKYHIMMNKFFMEEISGKFKVYMDDMIIKYDIEELHYEHLSSVF